jgi:molybdopterin-guanine dinucleotide biosynthesis protein A
MSRSPFVGVVLTGGSSRRMGTDKAFVDVDGTPLAERAFAILRAAGAQPIVAVGGDLERLAAVGYEVVDDPYPGQGPLGGLIGGLRHLDPEQLAFAMGCDQPAVSPALPAELVGRLLGEAPTPAAGITQAIVAVVAGVAQPLGAVYRATAREWLSTSFAAGERSLRRALDGLVVGWADDLDPAGFIDLDTPTDVEHFLEHYRGAADHYAAPDGCS